MGIISLSKIFGMPPSTHLSDNIMYNSMPVAEIYPQEPNFDLGMTLFSLNDAAGKYKSMVSAHGFTVSTPIRVAFLADSFPTDSFTNEYGENFFQKFADFATSAVGDIAQVLNLTDFKSFLDNASKGDGMINSAASAAKRAMSEAQDFMTTMGNSTIGPNATNAIANMGKTLEQMATGGKVDFPQVWRNSGFSPSYSMTVRLYNPNPKSDAATQKYIVGPICALLCLCLPRSADGATYKWPFLHKVICPGIYGLSSAYISNISIIKGGDQQNIAWNQRLSIVDVRLDFGSLYSSILVDEAGQSGKLDAEKRPYLSGYLDAISQFKTLKSNKATGAGASRRPSEAKLAAARAAANKNTVSKNVSQEQKSFEKDPPPRKNQEQVAKMGSLIHAIG